MGYSFLLLAGGIGSRINIGRPKQYAELHGIPMIMYSLVAIKNIEGIKEIVINYPDGEKENIERYVRSSGIQQPVKYVKAGQTRQDSVRLMLDVVSSQHVIIHESARPMVDESTFMNLIQAQYDNCGYMHEIPFTVAPVDPDTRQVTGALDRTHLRNVLLPQKFNLAEIKDAHAHAQLKNAIFTEDACLLVEAGYDFFFIDGDDKNIKVTYKSDLVLAESLLQHDTSEGSIS